MASIYDFWFKATVFAFLSLLISKPSNQCNSPSSVILKYVLSSSLKASTTRRELPATAISSVETGIISEPLSLKRKKRDESQSETENTIFLNTPDIRLYQALPACFNP